VLKRLEARGFRNLEPLEVELDAGFHLILGPNGAGKTSLLEAVYLLATTRSFRTPRLADCCRHETSSFHLAGEVVGENRSRLEIGFDAGERRRTKNGDRTSLAEHLATLPVVAWTAADVEILIGSPAERRRFLDRGVVGRRAASIEVLSRYRRALHEKRRLLQADAGRHRGAELESWNAVLAAAAAELIELRAAYVEELSRSLAEVFEACRLDMAEVTLGYRCSPRSGRGGSAAIYEDLAAAASRELQMGQPLIGPHRDDLRILWNGRALRRVASAGERKALGLVLAAAHGETLRRSGAEPTFLLDDADAELDPRRLEALWRGLGGAGQLLATSNRPAVWDAVEGRRLYCDSGRFSSERL
jgi:DNA replication and repair protein RecF